MSVINDLLIKRIKKLEMHAAKISAKFPRHDSIPVWRSKALSNVLFLSNHIDMLSKGQLISIIALIDTFLVSYDNSIGGYCDRWTSIQAELVERLEQLQEDGNTTFDEDEAKIPREEKIMIATNNMTPEKIVKMVKLWNQVSRQTLANELGIYPQTLSAWRDLLVKTDPSFAKQLPKRAFRKTIITKAIKLLKANPNSAFKDRCPEK